MLVSGYWILKGNYPYFIQNQVSSICQFMAQTIISKIFHLWLSAFGGSVFGPYGPFSDNMLSKNEGFRFQVSGVRERRCLILKPGTRHLKPIYIIGMFAASQGLLFPSVVSKKA